MKRYVVDASFLIDALIDLRSPAMTKLDKCLEEVQKEGAKLLGPPILQSEFANSISRNKNLADDRALAEVFSIFIALPIEYRGFDFDQIWQQVQTARELGQTVYDYSHHFLAILAEGIFLTCDKRYYAAAKQLGSIELI